MAEAAEAPVLPYCPPKRGSITGLVPKGAHNHGWMDSDFHHVHYEPDVVDSEWLIGYHTHELPWPKTKEGEKMERAGDASVAFGTAATENPMTRLEQALSSAGQKVQALDAFTQQLLERVSPILQPQETRIEPDVPHASSVNAITPAPLPKSEVVREIEVIEAHVVDIMNRISEAITRLDT